MLLKVQGHGSIFLDSLSQPFEIGPTDLRMTQNAFGAKNLLMATYIEQDIKKKVGFVLFIVNDAKPHEICMSHKQ